MILLQTVFKMCLGVCLLSTGVSSDCSGDTTTYNSATGTITSPGWPDTEYPSDLECIWIISLSSGSYPSFIVTDLVLEESENCVYDYLQIIDSGKTLTNLCGSPTDLPKAVVGISNIVILKFVTNHLLTDRGFQLQWFTTSEPGVILSTTTTTFNITTTPADGLDTTVYYALFAAILLVAGGPFLAIIMKKKKGQAAVAAIRTRAPIPSDPPPPYERYDPAQQQQVVTINTTSVQQAVPPQPDPLHIMISYQWGVKPQVLKFRERLHREGYRVWIDVEQMHKSSTTYEGMAIAVRQASVVVPVLTKLYPESENCRKEIQFADKCNKPLVPIRLDSEFSPKEGWLGELLGDTVWYDLSNSDTYEQQFTNFLGAVANFGNDSRMEDPAAYEVFPRQHTTMPTIGL